MLVFGIVLYDWQLRSIYIGEFHAALAFKTPDSSMGKCIADRRKEEREGEYLELIRFTPFAQKHPLAAAAAEVVRSERDYSPVLFISFGKSERGKKDEGVFFLPFFSLSGGQRRHIFSFFVPSQEIVTMVCAAKEED